MPSEVAPLASVVDTRALLETIAWSLAAGLGITFAFSVAILGAAKFTDLRAAERPVAGWVFAAVGSLALLVVIVAIVYGVVVVSTE